ncbi:hypothetical protein GCM10009724_22060 [Microbacterium lacticum]|nr:hypothetical protein MLA01_03010 [Microbacterium lacticum]GGI70841.1 hypothetical protein GCM10009724_22060 [Microbacterium lacticum]
MALIGLVRLGSDPGDARSQRGALEPICTRIFEETASRRRVITNRPGLLDALAVLGDEDVLVRHDPGGTRPPTGDDPAGPPGPDPVTRLSGRAGRVPAALSARDREFRELATEVGGRTSRCRQVR